LAGFESLYDVVHAGKHHSGTSRSGSTRSLDSAYSPKATTEALRRISNRPLSERIVLFFARLAFRGIYFPQMTVRQWVVLLLKNRRPVLSFCYEAAIRNRMRRFGNA